MWELSGYDITCGKIQWEIVNPSRKSPRDKHNYIGKLPSWIERVNERSFLVFHVPIEIEGKKLWL